MPKNKNKTKVAKRKARRKWLNKLVAACRKAA